MAITLSGVAEARPRQRSTVLGLEVWEACGLAAGLVGVVMWTGDGVDGAWDVFVAVGFIVLLVGLVGTRLAGRRGPDEPRALAGRQDWPLTILLVTAVALFGSPDEPSEGAWWPYPIVIAALGSAGLLAIREWRARGRRSQEP